MKKYYLVFSCLIGMLLIMSDAISNSSGAPAGRTGSPASNGLTCAAAGCHSGPSPGPQSITISSDIPAAGFQPNTTYTITVTADDGGSGITRAGFEASVESATGTGHLGQVAAPASDVRLTGTNYVTHTSGGTAVSGGTRSWDFEWTSSTAADTATIYVAVNFSNNNGATSGDIILTNQLGISADESIGNSEHTLSKVAVYPNPSEGLVFLENLSWGKNITVYDLRGSELLETQTKVLSNGRSYVDLQNLPAGSYLLQVEGENQLIRILLR